MSGHGGRHRRGPAGGTSLGTGSRATSEGRSCLEHPLSAITRFFSALRAVWGYALLSRAVSVPTRVSVTLRVFPATQGAGARLTRRGTRGTSSHNPARACGHTQTRGGATVGKGALDLSPVTHGAGSWPRPRVLATPPPGLAAPQSSRA